MAGVAYGGWGSAGRMKIPPPRGRLSAWLAETLQGNPSAVPATSRPFPVSGTLRPGPAWKDEDLQLALWCCYELHYRGFDDVDDSWEWHPAIVGFRGSLERQWLVELRSMAGDGAGL